jgi:hypothetical protein
VSLSLSLISHNLGFDLNLKRPLSPYVFFCKKTISLYLVKETTEHAPAQKKINKPTENDVAFFFFFMLRALYVGLS